MNNQLYESIKAKVLNMDFWFPPTRYYTCDGIEDGQQRKIHLDGMVFNWHTITLLKVNHILIQ